jgi:hypothetical protein
MIFSIDKEFLATFALPLAVGLTSAVLPSWYLEHAAKQPWAKQYLITSLEEGQRRQAQKYASPRSSRRD